VSKLAYMYLLLLCLGQVHLLFGYTSLYWLVSRTICSVVTCEGGIYLLALNPLPSQNPRSSGTSPLGLTSLNRKNLPIEVTLGGIGSVTPVCLFTSIFYPNYKLCDNKDDKNMITMSLMMIYLYALTNHEVKGYVPFDLSLA
jgi:hypothetical protein